MKQVIKFVKVCYLLAALLLLGLPARAQVTVSLSPVPVLQFNDGVGKPLANGRLYSYISGSNTLQATYRDSLGVAQNPNPTILDSNGRAQIWLARQAYKLVLQNAAGQQIWSVDGVKDSALALLSSNNVWLNTNTFQAATTFNDIVTLNNGGTFAGTIAGQPNWANLQLFPAGFQVGLTGVQFTSPPGSNTVMARAAASGYTEMRLAPNSSSGIFNALFTLYRTDPSTSGGNDEYLNFDSINAGNCILVATPCFRFESHHLGTGVTRPLVFDIKGGDPTILFDIDGSLTISNATTGPLPTLKFIGNEPLGPGRSWEIQENQGFLSFADITSSPNVAMTLGAGVTFTPKISIGSGTQLTYVLHNSYALDAPFTSIAAQTCQEQHITLGGSPTISTTASVTVNPATNPSFALMWGGNMISAGVIAVRICNVSSGAVTPASMNWIVSVIQ